MGKSFKALREHKDWQLALVSMDGHITVHCTIAFGFKKVSAYGHTMDEAAEKALNKLEVAKLELGS